MFADRVGSYVLCRLASYNVCLMAALTVYIGYAKEDAALFSDLRQHLLVSGTTVLHRGLVAPGDDEDTAAAKLLSSADLFVPLISAEYLASEHGQREINSANKLIIPVLARACSLKGTPLDGLQRLPRSRKAVASIRDRAPVWSEIAAEILKLAPSQAAVSPTVGSSLSFTSPSRTSRLNSSTPTSVPIVSASPLPMFVDTQATTPQSAAQSTAPEKHKFSLVLKWGTLALTITLSSIALGWGFKWIHPPVGNANEDMGWSETTDLTPPADMSWPELQDFASPVDQSLDLRVRKRRDMATAPDLVRRAPMPDIDRQNTLGNCLEVCRSIRGDKDRNSPEGEEARLCNNRCQEEFRSPPLPERSPPVPR